jgi:hypothetical protein
MHLSGPVRSKSFLYYSLLMIIFSGVLKLCWVYSEKWGLRLHFSSYNAYEILCKIFLSTFLLHNPELNRAVWFYTGNVRRNVTFRRFRVTIFFLCKSSKYCIFWVCVCSLSYATCQAHASYYIAICCLSHCTIFPHYLINGTIFGETLLDIKCVLIFCTNYVWNISNSRSIQRDIIT